MQHSDEAGQNVTSEGALQARLSEAQECIRALERKLEEAESATRRAKVAERHYRLLFDRNPAPMWLYDTETLAFLAVNQAAVSNYGYSREEFLSMTIRDIRPAEDVPTLVEDIRHMAAGPNRSGAWRHRTADGTIIDVDITSHDLDFSGRPARLVLARDITEKKRAEAEIRELNTDLERRVLERTAELEAANRELEAFSYSVSHDLRSPLRSIDGFSQALLEDHLDALDPEAADYLHRVRAAAQRMAQLIDDLLQLSRVTRAELRRQPVNLSEMARTIATELAGSQPKREVTFLVADDLVAAGDPSLLRVALENLLSNAWKFTSEHARATIEFTVGDHDGEPAFHVRDDGAGFDMAYADKLFGAFQRLHALAEFEGTGIGLATVQRIIHRHGGRVWAEGEVEKGATVYFTLP